MSYKYKKKQEKENPNMGRPRVEIKWKEFDELCALHCTLDEIAGWYGCSDETIKNRVKEEHDMTFLSYFKIKSQKGKISLRRSQFLLAKKNPAMGIWLGKQILGQSERFTLPTGEDGGTGFIAAFFKVNGNGGGNNNGHSVEDNGGNGKKIHSSGPNGGNGHSGGNGKTKQKQEATDAEIVQEPDQ